MGRVGNRNSRRDNERREAARDSADSATALPISLRTLADFPHVAIAEETGASFAENARQKALHYAGATGMLTMAEDSGFEVDALNGEPGIYSARYLREDATYDERFADIYRRARESGSTNRSARFVCALAVAHGATSCSRPLRQWKDCSQRNPPVRTASGTTRFSCIRPTAGRSAKCPTTRRLQ